MASKIIPANGQLSINTPGYYLSIINTTGTFKIESPTFGELAAVTGRKFDLHAQGKITTVNFVNESDEDIEVDFESANIPVTGGSSAVSVSNEVVVKEIKKGITSYTTVTGIEDGQVRQLVSDHFRSLPIVKIAAKSKKRIIAANDQTNRTVTMQNISPQYAELWVGDNYIAANKGSFFGGSKLAPASDVIKNSADIYVYNDSDFEAVVTVREEYRA